MAKKWAKIGRETAESAAVLMWRWEQFAIYNRYRVLPEYYVHYDDLRQQPSAEEVAEFIRLVGGHVHVEAACDWLMHSKLDVQAAVDLWRTQK